jgi:DNA-directed RNA polymerase specialized sigma subunit
MKLEKDLKWINAITRKFSNTYGLGYDEMLSEAYLAYCDAMNSLEPGFHVLWKEYATSIIVNRLTDYVHRERRIRKYSVRIDLIVDEFRELQPRIQKHLSLNLIYSENYSQTLSEDVQEVINLVLHSPEDFSKILPKLARGKIVKTLRSYGWSWSRVWDAMRNTKAALKQMPQDCIII